MIKLALLGNYESSLKLYTFLKFSDYDIQIITNDNKNYPQITITKFFENIDSYTHFFLSYKNFEDLYDMLKKIPLKKTIILDKEIVHSYLSTETIIALIKEKELKLLLNINRIYDYKYIKSFMVAINKNKKNNFINIEYGINLSYFHWIYNIVPFLIIRNEQVLNFFYKNENKYLVITNRARYLITSIYSKKNKKIKVKVNNVIIPDPNYYDSIYNCISSNNYSQVQHENILFELGKMREKIELCRSKE